MNFDENILDFNEQLVDFILYSSLNELVSLITLKTKIIMILT